MQTRVVTIFKADAIRGGRQLPEALGVSGRAMTVGAYLKSDIPTPVGYCSQSLFPACAVLGRLMG